jgi:hypothetical protein
MKTTIEWHRTEDQVPTRDDTVICSWGDKGFVNTESTAYFLDGIWRFCDTNEPCRRAPTFWAYLPTRIDE